MINSDKYIVCVSINVYITFSFSSQNIVIELWCIEHKSGGMGKMGNGVKCHKISPIYSEIQNSMVSRRLSDVLNNSFCSSKLCQVYRKISLLNT